MEGMVRVGSSGVDDKPNTEGADKPNTEVGEDKPAKVNIPNIPKNESKLSTDSEALECTPATSSPKKSNMIAQR